MTETSKVILKLAVLIVPALILLGTLYGGSKSKGIGGGGYDLSEMVYSCLFTLFVICWNIWIVASLLMAKTPEAKLNNKILLVVGIISLVASAVWFLKDLR